MARYEINNIDAPIDFQGRDFTRRTLQNAKNLLMCRMGEVPYDRMRGLNQALFELPMSKLREELLPELDLVMMYEPDVEVVSAEAKLLDDGGLYIRCVLDVTDDA